MTQISTALSLLAASQVGLFMVMLALSDNPKRVKFTGLMLMAGIVMYLVLPLVDLHFGVRSHSLVWLPGALTSSMLLLFVWFVFEEHECRLPNVLIGLVTVSVITSIYYAAINVGIPGAPLWKQLLELFIVATALHIVNRGQDSDLVEQRFHARRLFITMLASTMLIVMTIDVLARFNPGSGLEGLQKTIAFLFAVAFNIYFVRQNPTVQLVAKAQPIQEKPEDPELIELLEKMRNERLYADHDLRVGGLAEIMGIPEYQLRKKINQELGYRNFNQFVNRYRIEEAGARLRENSRTPVLTVALEVGFKSISSFNTAFQAQYGVSPTKFRTGDAEATQS